MSAVAERPARVLVVHERYRYAGGEDAVVDAQVRLLERHGHAVERLELDHEAIPDAPSVREQLALGARTIWSTAGRRTVRRAVRAMRPDVVHAHNTFPLLSPAVLGAARAPGPAVVQTLHNYRLVCVNALLFRDGHPCEDCVGRPFAAPGIVHACYRGSRPASALVATMQSLHRARGTWRRDVDRFITLAWFARDRLLQGGVPAGRVDVVPNFADVEAVEPPARPSFLYVGRLAHEKGIATLLEAWAGFPGDTALRIAGTGPLDDTVRAAAAMDPRVTILGHITADQVRAEVARASAVVVPSHAYENCPMAIVEAFGAGRPVIGSAHGGIAEMVDDGVTGLLATPGDAASLRQRLLAAEQDPEAVRTMGVRARRIFEERYAPARGYQALTAVYTRAIAHRRGVPAS